MNETLAALREVTLLYHSTNGRCTANFEECERCKPWRDFTARGVRVGDDGLRAAAQAVIDGWHDYVEALAGRGHEGPHIAESVLEGACGPCEGARYGTEVAMSEYVIPALSAALAATSTPPEIDVERLSRALRYIAFGGGSDAIDDGTPIDVGFLSYSGESSVIDLAAAIAAAYKEQR